MLEVEYQTSSGFLHSVAATVCMYILLFHTCMGKKQDMCVVSKPYGFSSNVYIFLKYTVMQCYITAFYPLSVNCISHQLDILGLKSRGTFKQNGQNTQIQQGQCLLWNQSHFWIITMYLFCLWKTKNEETNVSCLNNKAKLVLLQL